MATMHSIPRYVSNHRKILLFLPIILGLLFWTAAVALADDKSLRDSQRVAGGALAEATTGDAAGQMIAYRGTYEKYGLRNKSKVLAAPFFDSDALKTIAIANAYRSKKLVDRFDELCPKMVAGQIALARKGKTGKFEIVRLAEYAAEGDRVGLKGLLSLDDSYLLTSAHSISERSPDLRLVSWNADSSLERLPGPGTTHYLCEGP